jgi:hypothetical protein
VLLWGVEVRVNFTPYPLYSLLKFHQCKWDDRRSRLGEWLDTGVKRKTSGPASGHMLIYIILGDIIKMLHRSGSSQENCLHYGMNHWRNFGINTQP